MPKETRPVLLIGTDDPTTWITANHLRQRFEGLEIVIEDKVARSVFLKNRVRKLGLAAVTGQIAFVSLVRPLLRLSSASRIREILSATGLDPAMPPPGSFHRVNSINGDEAHAIMRRINPAVVVVNGTRILKPATLNCVSARFINTHQGITPRYRGAHGAYWALFNNDPSNCGVTIHLVDEGIDTGNVIAQTAIAPTAKDNFVTYPFLQVAAALAPLEQAVRAAAKGNLNSRVVEGPSAVWYHPGLFQYLGGLMRGVR